MNTFTDSKPEYGLASREMLGMPRRKSLEKARLLLQGRLILDNIIRETPFYPVDQMNCFDWNVRYSNSPTTVQMYLQGLTPVSFLVGGYVLSRNREMYALADQFVRSWIAFCPDEVEVCQGSYIWDQHSVSMRTEALLYFLLVGVENGLLSLEEERILRFMLERHADYLLNEAYYLPHENHGVFEDRALIYLALAWKRTDWLDIGMDRVWDQWQFLFSENGVCTENSYTYQRVDKSLFLEVANVLEKRAASEVSRRLYEGLRKAEEFMGYALFPDGTSPPYGDSQRDSYLGIHTQELDGVLAYAAGGCGPEPETTSVIYPREGYYIGREFWAEREESGRRMLRSDPMWVFLRSGFQSLTHRQADDNSFMLYARGYDVFTDSGMYSHMFRDPIRQYVRSANAHNTVIVDGKSYNFLRMDYQDLCGIFHSQLDRSVGCDYVASFSRLYCGVTHIRHFLYFRTDILIVDELTSENEHRYSQLFHCGRRTELEEASMEGAVLQLGGGTDRIALWQRQRCNDWTLYRGRQETPRYGNISEQMNELIPVNTLKYDQWGQRVAFVTQISLLNDAGQPLSGLDATVNLSERNITLRGFPEEPLREIALVQAPFDSFRFPMDQIRVKTTKEGLCFTNTAVYPEPVQYAWYLLGADEKTVLAQIRYRDDPTYTVSSTSVGIKEGEVYTVRAFVHCRKERRKAAQNVARFVRRGGKFAVDFCLDYDRNFSEWKEYIPDGEDE